MQLSEQGLKDGLRDIAAIRLVLAERRRDAEAVMARAEVDVNDLRKLEAFAQQQQLQLADQMARLTGAPAETRPAL